MQRSGVVGDHHVHRGQQGGQVRQSRLPGQIAYFPSQVLGRCLGERSLIAAADEEDGAAAS